MDNIIEADKLSKVYKIAINREDNVIKRFFFKKYEEKIAVDQITFSIKRGEMVGYLGLNGAGKSTTIKLLSGILVPTSGQVRISGKDPSKERKSCSENMAVVFGQNNQLLWDLPVSDSLQMARYLYNLSLEQYLDNLHYLDRFLGIGEILERPVRQLSLGQRMKANLAYSLLHDPDILCLDEPTLGLDIVIKEQVHDCINRLNKERGITVLLTSHDVADIGAICRRVMVIDNGSLIFENDLGNLMSIYGSQDIIFMPGNAEDLASICELLRRSQTLYSVNVKGEVHIEGNMKEFIKTEVWKEISSTYCLDYFTTKGKDLKEVLLRLYTILDGKNECEK